MAGSIYIVRQGPQGIVATHPDQLELPAMVAPVVEEALPGAFNTLRPPLQAIGCMRLFDTGFDFDSSFILPEAEESFTHFTDLMLFLRKKDQQGRFPPCSVFGHADPTGTDDYNKKLSGRRALSVYAVLVRDPSIWHDLYDQPLGADDWHGRSVQQCLSVSLKTTDGVIEPPFYSGPIDGAKTPESQRETDDAVSAYRTDRFGKTSPHLTPDERKHLFKEYMDVIFHSSDGERVTLDPAADFISRGAGEKLKGDVQGCGEFNPKVLLSQDELDADNQSKAGQEERNDLYVADRRVLVFIFKHGAQIAPERWPCPKVTAPPGDCKARFWSDYLDRIKPAQSERRVFGEKMRILSIDGGGAIQVEAVENTGNTMACRFYHGLAVRSPCEAKLKEWVIRFLVDHVEEAHPDARLLYLTGRRYVVHVGETEDAAVVRGVLGAKGEIRIPVLDEQTKILIKIDAYGLPQAPDDPDKPPADDHPPSSSDHADEAGYDTDRFEDEDLFPAYMLDGGALRPFDAGDDLTVKQRLYNLGFGEGAPAAWTQAEFDAAMDGFRVRRGLQDADDAAVRQAVRDDHEAADLAAAVEPGAAPDDAAATAPD